MNSPLSSENSKQPGGDGTTTSLGSRSFSNPATSLRENLSRRLREYEALPLIPVVDASTDPGDDTDDILKMAAAAFLQNMLTNQVASVIERGPIKERASLARGALDLVGLKGVELAVGSHYSYGSGPCHPLAESIMADPNRAFVRSNVMLKELLELARPRSLTLLCIGGLQDLCETIFLEPALVQEKVAQVVFMGGVCTLKDKLVEVDGNFRSNSLPHNLDEDFYSRAFGRQWRLLHAKVKSPDDFEHTVFLNEQGRMVPDPRAANNKFDYTAAVSVYTALQVWRIPMVVFSRHAAAALDFPRSFYDELAATSKHPVAEYLRDFQRDIVKHLWWRTWQSGIEREGLPEGCTPEWFGSKFCGDPTISQKISALNDPWEYVQSFSPYDVGAFLSADPRIRYDLFRPEQVVVGGGCPPDNRSKRQK